MMRAILLIVLTSAAAQAQHDDHAHRHGPAPTPEAQIVVTINPEARVSAVVAASMPPLPRCGEASELKVQIVNQGFVTAPLRANLAGDAQGRVALHMDAVKLSGGERESRLLHLIPLGPDAEDVTVAFSIDNNIGDLGGRDRVHLLVRCLGSQ